MQAISPDVTVGPPRTLTGTLIVLWGVLGVVAFLSQAIYRIAPLAWEPLKEGSLTEIQALLYVGWLLFSGYAEGYRGFQKRFSPKVVGRALHLAANPRPLHVLFAPAFCMAYFHATKRGLITAWGVSSMIALIVIAVRHVPQPWRGIIDGGVVLGLMWGVVSLLVHAWRGMRGGILDVAIEVPLHRSQAEQA